MPTWEAFQQSSLKAYVINKDDIPDKKYNFDVANFSSGGTFNRVLEQIELDFSAAKSDLKKKAHSIKEAGRKAEERNSNSIITKRRSGPYMFLNSHHNWLVGLFDKSKFDEILAMRSCMKPKFQHFVTFEAV